MKKDLMQFCCETLLSRQGAYIKILDVFEVFMIYGGDRNKQGKLLGII